MGFDKIILLSWLVLFTSAIVSTQENRFGFDFSNLPHHPFFNFPVSPANGSFIRDNILPFFNGFTSLPNFFNPLRLKRSFNHDREYQNSINQHNANNNYQTRTSTQPDTNDRKINLTNDRLSVITRVTSCNYANQPGSRCLSCHEAITCFRNNRAVVRRCFFGHQYCNNGRCSFTPGNTCYSTSSTSIATISTSSSTSTITPTIANTTPTTITTSSTTPISTTSTATVTSSTSPTTTSLSSSTSIGSSTSTTTTSTSNPTSTSAISSSSTTGTSTT